MTSEHRASSSVRIGDISGLREELKDDKPSRLRTALQKLLELDLHSAKDVPAGIFRDVLSIRHQDLVDVKKLMYCFFQLTADILQTSDSVRDIMLQVKRDLSDRNPVVRAMAVKFVGHLGSQTLVAELIDTLKGCLSDGDPLVRKTAVICIGRLYRLMPTLGEGMNLLQSLELKLQDESAPVAINALATLRDLQATIGTELRLDSPSVRRLLLAMSEGSEWNQIVVLEAVSQFAAADDSEASEIVERVLPSLNHANSAVVLTASRVLLHQMETRGGIAWNAHSQDWANKMLKALEKSAASAEPSVQWVVMKCLLTIVQRWRDLSGLLDVRNFFVKYDDPVYIKHTKLDLICELIQDGNVDRVLTELCEYAGDADTSVAKKAVECLGVAALQLGSTAEKVVSALMELMTSPSKGNAGSSHSAMVQSIIPTMSLIFRAYPAQYESVIAMLCDNMDVVAAPEAKASLMWVIGEYADFIVEPWQKLQPFCENLENEPAAIQLAAVTSVTKIYLKTPTEQGSKLAQSVLEKGTQVDNPDVRHRAYFYWNMLSHDPQVAKEVVLADRPALDLAEDKEVTPLIKALVSDVPNLAVVYGVDPNTMGFSGNTTLGGATADGEAEAEAADGALDTQTSDLSKVNSADVAALEKRDESGLLEPLSTLRLEDSAPGTVEIVARPQNDSLIDLLDDDIPATPASLMGSTVPTPHAPAASAVPDPNDPFSLLVGSPTVAGSQAATTAQQPFQQPGLQQQQAFQQPGLQQQPFQQAGLQQQPFTQSGLQQQQQQQQTFAQPGLQPGATPAAPFGQPAAPAPTPPQRTASVNSQASSWLDLNPTPAAPAPILPPTPTPPANPLNSLTPTPGLAPTAPQAALPPLNTQTQSGNPFANPSVTSPTVAFTPTGQPQPGGALPPMAPHNSLASSTPSSNFSAPSANFSSNNSGYPSATSTSGFGGGQLTSPQNPYVPLATGPDATSFQGMGQGAGYSGGYGAPNTNGNVDFRGSNGSWPPPYSPQTTGMSGYGGYVAQHTGGFSQFATASFDPRASQQGMGMGGGFGQPMMHQGYQMQHTGGSMYGGGFGAPPPSGSLLLRRDAGQGLEIYGQFVGSRSSGGIYFQLHLTNHSGQELSGFMIQFNKNRLGLSPVRVNIDIIGLPPGGSRSVDVPVVLNPGYVNPQSEPELQVALKTQQLPTLFFKDALPMHVMQ